MRLRIRFSKYGKVRFTSHRDVARIWERALRRSELPVAYSEGFSPRPRLSFGLALSTGHESDEEYLDVDLDATRTVDIDVAALPGVLTAYLPVGMTATGVTVIDRQTPSLQQAVTSCTWQIDVEPEDRDRVCAAVSQALAAEKIVVARERKGKEVIDDLRPLVLDLCVDEPIEDGVRLIAELGTKPRSLRVSEMLSALQPPLAERRVVRLHQWITNERGERTDPMGVVSVASESAEAS